MKINNFCLSYSRQDRGNQLVERLYNQICSWVRADAVGDCSSLLSADLISCLEKGNDFTEAEFRYTLWNVCAHALVCTQEPNCACMQYIFVCFCAFYSKFCPAGCLTDFGEVSGTIPHGYRDVRAPTSTRMHIHTTTKAL